MISVKVGPSSCQMSLPPSPIGSNKMKWKTLGMFLLDWGREHVPSSLPVLWKNTRVLTFLTKFYFSRIIITLKLYRYKFWIGILIFFEPKFVLKRFELMDPIERRLKNDSVSPYIFDFFLDIGFDLWIFRVT